MAEKFENMELEQMREQLSLLKDKLREQEIVTERAIMQSVKQSVGHINHRGVFHIILGALAIPFCCWVFKDMGMSDNFVIGTGIMLGVCAIATIYAHIGLNFINISRNNLVQVGLRTSHLRKIYTTWYYIAVPMVVVWGYFLYGEFAALFSDKQELNIILAAAAIGGLIGGAIGVRLHFKTIHEADEILEHIRELTSDDKQKKN